MAKTLNVAILFGRLGKAPEMHYTAGGTAITTFSLATDRREKNSDGEWGNATDWHNVKMFGKDAEYANANLEKGKRCLVMGKQTHRKYEKDGKTNYFSEVTVDQMIVVDHSGELAQLDGEAAPAEEGIMF
jgi:single-strand DNA-binding protein